MRTTLKDFVQYTEQRRRACNSAVLHSSDAVMEHKLGWTRSLCFAVLFAVFVTGCHGSRNGSDGGQSEGGEATVVWEGSNAQGGLKLLDLGDGRVLEGAVEGVPCVKVKNPGEGYIYFALDPKFKTSPHMNALVCLEFLARGRGRFDIQFDGHKFSNPRSDPYSDTPVGFYFDAWPLWHRVALEVSDAMFANRQNNQADLRLRVSCPEFYLRRLTMTLSEGSIPAPPDGPKTSNLN